MATIPFTEELSEQRTRVFKWSGVTDADQFQHVELGGNLAEVTIAASGDFGTGGDVALLGSHDKATWHKVLDKGGSAISLQAAGYAAARDTFPYLKPDIDAGSDVEVDVTVAVTRAA